MTPDVFQDMGLTPYDRMLANVNRMFDLLMPQIPPRVTWEDLSGNDAQVYSDAERRREEPDDDDRPECEDCGEKIDGEVEYVDVNCYHARCAACWQKVYDQKEADRQEREDMRSFGAYQYRQSGTSPY
jgi:hypothetical protein